MFQAGSMRYVAPGPLRRLLAHTAQQMDFEGITVEYDNVLQDYYIDWSRRFAEDSDFTGKMFVRAL